MTTDTFATPGEFAAAVRTLVQAAAAAEHAPAMTWVDPDFAAWPLDEPALLEDLARWAVPHRRLVVMAADWTAVEHRHPRWVRLRRSHAHVVDCRDPDPRDHADLPSMLIVPGVGAVRRADPQAWRGWYHRHPDDILRCTEALADALERSNPGFPAHTLGL